MAVIPISLVSDCLGKSVLVLLSFVSPRLTESVLSLLLRSSDCFASPDLILASLFFTDLGSGDLLFGLLCSLDALALGDVLRVLSAPPGRSDVTDGIIDLLSSFDDCSL